MVPEWLQLVSVIASPAFAAGGAYMAVRTKLEWLRRDVDDVRARATDAHERIDELARDLSMSTRTLKKLFSLEQTS